MVGFTNTKQACGNISPTNVARNPNSRVNFVQQNFDRRVVWWDILDLFIKDWIWFSARAYLFSTKLWFKKYVILSSSFIFISMVTQKVLYIILSSFIYSRIFREWWGPKKRFKKLVDQFWDLFLFSFTKQISVFLKSNQLNFVSKDSLLKKF